MEMIPLAAAVRQITLRPNVLRRSGHVPCIMYGNKVENTPIACAEGELKKAYRKAGENTLVELSIDGKKLPVLFHSVDLDPVSDRLIHADFYAVDMTQELEAPVPIDFQGVPTAIAEFGGILSTPVDTVTVRCLPSKLPHSLVLNIATMTQLFDARTVADIVVPEGVTILDNKDIVVASIQEKRKEEVVEVAPAVTPEGEAPTTAAEGTAAPADAGKTPEKK